MAPAAWRTRWLPATLWAQEFRTLLDQIETSVPADLDVHLILDNYSTHKAPTIRRWLAQRPRFHLHFTPTYASWINRVDRWFAALEAQALRRGSFTSVPMLKTAILAHIDAAKTADKPFNWKKSDRNGAMSRRSLVVLPAVLPAISASTSRFLTFSDPFGLWSRPITTGFSGILAETGTGS